MKLPLTCGVGASRRFKRPKATGNPHPNLAPYSKFQTRTCEIFVAAGNDPATEFARSNEGNRYFVENWRRNRWLRSQPDLARLEDDERLIAQLLHYLLVEKNSVRETIAKHPELTAIAKKAVSPG